MTVANLGDSRAIVCRAGVVGPQSFIVKAESTGGKIIRDRFVATWGAAIVRWPQAWFVQPPDSWRFLEIPGDSWRFLKSWAVRTAVDNLHERANSKAFKGFSWPEANRTSSNRECQQLRTSLQKVCRINLDSVLDSVSRKQADIHSIEWHKDVFYM